jgi:hypothetical protein
VGFVGFQLQIFGIPGDATEGPLPLMPSAADFWNPV